MLPMTELPLSPLLGNCSLGLCIIERSGILQWANASAQALLQRLGVTDNIKTSFSSHDWGLIQQAKSPLVKELSLGSLADSERQKTVITVAATNEQPDCPLLLTLAPVSGDQTSLAQREEILSTAAHDLKNPIGAIFGYADTLLETNTGTGLSERQRDIITKIRSTTARSLELVRNYQQLADLTLRDRKLPAGNIDLNTVVKDVLEFTWREDPAKHTVHAVFCNEPLKVPLDKVQMDRVISNLYINALRYTPAGERIVIKTELEGKNAHLQITNTGVSISPEDQAKLFQAHARAATSKGTSGTGLGLYIVKQIVESAGGSIVLESSPKIGTTFTVKLPVK